MRNSEQATGSAAISKIIPTRCASWGLLATGMMIFNCIPSAEAGERPSPKYSVVEVRRTPGKPSAPTEYIRASSFGGAFSLDVGRVGNGGFGDDEWENVEISEAEYLALCELVEERGLDSFQPEASTGDVFDFGEAVIKVQPAENQNDDRDTPSLEAKWEGSLTNEGDVKPLFKAMAKLAEEHCKSTRLHYLTSGSRD